MWLRIFAVAASTDGWHTQVLKAGRHKVHEDFAAVARDLVDRGITTRIFWQLRAVATAAC